MDINPTSERTWLTLLGTSHGHNTYGHGGDSSHEEVHELLRRAIDAIPQSPDLRYELGLLTLSEGRPEEAIEVFDSALEHSPAHLPSLTLAALARADVGVELDMAERQLEIAMALKNDDPVLQDIQGWIDLSRNQTEQAVAALEAALGVQPEDATIGRNVPRPPDSTPFPSNPNRMMALTDDFFTQHQTPTYN